MPKQVAPRRIAVLLFNLGGPDGQADVRPFLQNLFSDRRIISLPWGIRQLLAWVISARRAASARANYMKMGGGSPLLAETRKQAEALELALNQSPDRQVKVFVGMRYWHPFIDDVARQITAWKPDETVVLPLYPQFSSTTTLSGFDVFDRAFSAPVRKICCYAADPTFISAHAEIVRQWLGLMSADTSQVRILFSAHGLPEKTIQAGDPYQEQVEATVSAVAAALGPDAPDHRVCYQSRVGPLAWIGPSTEEALHEAATDRKAVLVVPIAFVSEHIETRVELDLEYAELAAELGIKTYARAPTLSLSPVFIQALAGRVEAALITDQPILGDHECSARHPLCPRRRAA